MKEYPSLSWIAGSTLAGTASHYIITGTDATLKQAKDKLADKGHQHTVEHH